MLLGTQSLGLSIDTTHDTNAGYTKNYFTSCDPHHDIYTFSYWQIFWHSI